MPKGELLYEGRGKKVYASGETGKHIMEFTDESTSYDGGERASFENKAASRNHISSILMRTLEENGVPTIFERPEGAKSMIIADLKTLPVEVVCYNAAGGSFSNRMGLSDGEILPLAVLEFFVNGKGPSGPPTRLKTIKGTRAVTDADVKNIQSHAMLANKILKQVLLTNGYILAELRLEFGRDAMGLMLVGDEISPDTCRIWKKSDFEKIDRDMFRKDTGADSESYTAFARALTD